LKPPVFIAAGTGAAVAKVEFRKFNGVGRRTVRALARAGVSLMGSGSTGSGAGSRDSFGLGRSTTDITGNDLSGNVLLEEPAHVLLVVVLRSVTRSGAG
jgi:hypothetical protein